MESIASALGSIPAIVWGERAMYFLGVRIICDHYMLVIDDAEIASAAQRLRSAGFKDCAWSYGAREPDFYEERQLQHILRRITDDYSNLDQNSMRFLFSEKKGIAGTPKVVLLPSSYARISLKSTSAEGFTRDGDLNIFYPDSALLLGSFIRVSVREPVAGMWKSNLSMWAISYVFGELMVRYDVLDSIDDEEAKAWFNEKTLRFTGGMDRTTCFKRLGRKGYDERLARRVD